MDDASTASERFDSVYDSRRLTDRRRFGWRTVLYGFVRSRRRGSRRWAEGEPVFSDWHHPWLFFLAVGIMLMSTLDAVLTLRLIGRGATEVNPVMAAAMGGSPLTFAVSKMLLTGFSVLVLVYLARAQLFNRFRTGVTLTAAFLGYACLICYEFVLLMGTQ